MEQFVTNHPLFSEMKLVRTLTKSFLNLMRFLGNSLPVEKLIFMGAETDLKLR